MEKIDFEQHHGLLIEQISIVVQKKVLNHLKNHHVDISFNEFLILMLLKSQEKGLTPKAISEKLHKDKSFTTRLISHLEKNKFISKIKNTEDTRSYTILITPKGIETLHMLDEIMIPFEKEFVESLKKSEYEVFKSVLKKLLSHSIEKL